MSCFSASLTWRLNDFGAGYYTSYVGGVNDTGATDADGNPFRVDDYMTHNLYVQYQVDDEGSLLNDLRLRVGVRNIFNRLGPVADASYGYIGDLYGNRGRMFYASLRKRF